MKGNSCSYPEIVVKSAGKTQVRFNVLKVVRDGLGVSSYSSFDFDYVEIEGELLRAKIIDAVISLYYSKSDELSLINNELAKPGSEEFAVYQTRRVLAKSVADLVINSKM